MRNTAASARLLCLVAALPLVITHPLLGEAHSKSRDLIVERPSDLPEQARVPAESCFLYSDQAGTTYLYVEQQQGARLVAFDVTDPARIKMAYSIVLSVPGPFDFVRPLNGQAELVRFRDGRGFAALDLHKSKSPAIKMIGNLANSASAESLSANVVLVENQPNRELAAIPRDYQVIDTSAPSEVAVLATVKQVTSKAVNGYTGTTFLLGSEGLSVIRRPSVENENKLHMAQ